MHKDSTLSLDRLQAKALQLGVERLSSRRPEGTLTPTLQMAGQRGNHILIDIAERHLRVTKREVMFPAAQQPVDHTDESRNGSHRVGGQQRTQLLAKASHGLLRREHIQVATFAAVKVAVVSKR